MCTLIDMDNVHTRPTQPSIQCVTSTLSLGVMRAECEAEHASAEVKNEWSQTSTSQQPFLWCTGTSHFTCNLAAAGVAYSV